MKKWTISLLIAGLAGVAIAAEPIATLRGAVELAPEPSAPRMTQFDDSDQRQTRNYPEQPPIIPHDIDGYRIDLSSNKCLSCHARSRTGESGAPMVSITHFMDGDGQFKAAVTPRRYFCTQCHVPQHPLKPLVGNDFVDVDSVLSAE